MKKLLLFLTSFTPLLPLPSPLYHPSHVLLSFNISRWRVNNLYWWNNHRTKTRPKYSKCIEVLNGVWRLQTMTTTNLNSGNSNIVRCLECGRLNVA